MDEAYLRCAICNIRASTYPDARMPAPRLLEAADSPKRLHCDRGANMRRRISCLQEAPQLIASIVDLAETTAMEFGVAESQPRTPEANDLGRVANVRGLLRQG